jgi:hypothetical protein
MNKDIFEGKCKEMRGQIKDWWGKLTNDDNDRSGATTPSPLRICMNLMPIPSSDF